MGKFVYELRFEQKCSGQLYTWKNCSNSLDFQKPIQYKKLRNNEKYLPLHQSFLKWKKSIQIWADAMTRLAFLALKWAFSMLSKAIFLNLHKACSYKKEWRFFHIFTTKKMRKIPLKLSWHGSKTFQHRYFIPFYVVK